MKKLITLVVCLALALTTAAALAESGTDPLHDHLAKLADTPYTISTTEYGPLEPGDFPSDIFVELLNNMKFEKAEGVEAPDGSMWCWPSRRKGSGSTSSWRSRR